MKKRFLILSALLTVVLGAVSLQSCSSDDNYTTEEYGYYTEEEIAAIKALGEMYDLDLTIDENYYGLKVTLSEMEESIIEVLNIEGEYELVNLIQNNTDGTYSAKMTKKSADINRTKTRSVESELPIRGTVYGISGDSTPCALTISWENGKKESWVSFSVNYPYSLTLDGRKTVKDYLAVFSNNSFSVSYTLSFYRNGIYISSFLVHGSYFSNLNALSITKVQ